MVAKSQAESDDYWEMPIFSFGCLVWSQFKDKGVLMEAWSGHMQSFKLEVPCLLRLADIA